MTKLTAAAAVLVLCAGPVAAQDSKEIGPSIVTVGEATIKRAADQAFVTVSVETRSRVPKDAQQQNAAVMNAVQQRLADAGIVKDAIRTTGYSIYQEFDYSSGRRIPREYLARNGVEVRLDAIDRTGEILDILVQAGATTVSGVRFDLKDRVSVERDVLRHAVEDARARADAMAAGAGRTIDRVVKIEDNRQPRSYGPVPQAMVRAAVAGNEAVPTSIEGGMIEVRATITLTVALK